MIRSCTAAVLLSAAGLASADRMYACDAGTDSLYIFDTATGATVSVIGPLNPDPARYVTPVSMAVSPGGSIYVINNSPAGDANLSRVDPATGIATHIGGTVGDSISFGPGGRLYGMLGTRLATVSTATGVATSLGGPSLPRLYGLDYDQRSGLFYGVTSAAPFSVPELLVIDPATGAPLATIPMSRPTVGSVPGGIAFERDGTLVMTDLGRRVWEVDASTGVMTLRATTSDVPQGLGPAPCRADLDGDGRLTVFDFLAFQIAFGRGDARADFDGDGAFTIFDFLAFQSEFDAGC